MDGIILIERSPAREAILAIALRLMITICLVTSLLAANASFAAPSRAKRSPLRPTRVETVAYSAPYMGIGLNNGQFIANEVNVPGGDETYASVKVEDQTGTTISGRLIQSSPHGPAFCGQTPDPVLIEPDYTLTIALLAPTCMNGQPSIVTAGTVEVTFYTRTSPPPRGQSFTREYSLAAHTCAGHLEELPKGNLLVGCIIFPPYTVGKSLDLEVTDDSGAEVYARVYQRISNRYTAIGDLCGATNAALAPRPSQAVEVWLYEGRCPDGTPSQVTRGVVEATFSSSRT